VEAMFITAQATKQMLAFIDILQKKISLKNCYLLDSYFLIISFSIKYIFKIAIKKHNYLLTTSDNPVLNYYIPYIC